MEDRISSLSDDILLLILSLLPLMEMVKTSLLSRRWLNLWEYTPVLHFDVLFPEDPPGRRYKEGSQHRKYVKWINCVLRQHKGQYLKEFKIVHCFEGYYDNKKDIDRWLVFALAKKVECLELNLLRKDYEDDDQDYRIDYVFPSPFLKRQCLQFDLNCLKSLSFTFVDVTGEAIGLVLGNCPVLERLEVVSSSTLIDLVISDPALVLKYLRIYCCHYLEVLCITNFNLISLDISSIHSIVDLTLTSLPMLVELIIDGSSRCISQASSCFSRLQAFTLCGMRLKDTSQLSNYRQLTKLKRLVITIFGRDDDLTKLISIVNACPLLEEFVFQLCSVKPEQIGRTMSDVKRGSSSLKGQSLKVFEFMGYCGRVKDVKLIMHVVENGVGLEKVVIHPVFLCKKGEIAKVVNDVGLDKVVIRSIFRCYDKEKAIRIASEHFDSLRKAIPQHIRLIIRY